MLKKDAFIICGPTSSGKSLLSLKFAQKQKSAIINADSMQVYKGLELLSSSPSSHQKSQTPHFLYNFIIPDDRYNLARYINDCKHALIECDNLGLLPIITGGTGMYINALVQGFSDIPTISEEAKAEVADIEQTGGTGALYQYLQFKDPKMASMLAPNDRARIARSLGVFLSTKQSIVDFHQSKTQPILHDYNIRTICIIPERDSLYERCNLRFDKVIKEGAVEEVSNFVQQYSHIDFGITKTLGYKQIRDFIRGIKSLESAIADSKQTIRNYAKRQYTWFNNQISWQKEIINTLI